jgi:quercetin dioxygenase-like cupin family protein
MGIRGKKAGRANGPQAPFHPARRFTTMSANGGVDFDASRVQTEEETMSLRITIGATLTAVALVLSLSSMAQAVELNPAAVAFQTPDQFKWRDPTDQAATNQVILQGDPNKPGSLYININKFKANRFGNAHYHPNDRFISVIAGAAWRGTGTVVDPAHATRVPKGTFMVDHANKVHWDGTKEETGAYLITGIGPATNIETPKATGPWAGGDPSAATIKLPDQIVWKDNGPNKTVTLAGDPEKEGLYVQMLTWKKGNFSRPHFHPNDRYIYVLEGTWWVGSGNKFDPDNLTVPMKADTYVTHFAKGVHWDGAKADEDATIILIGMGPATNTRVEEAK